MKYQGSLIFASLVAAIIMIGLLSAVEYLFGKPIPGALYAAIPGMWLLTLMLYRSVMKADTKSPGRFVTAFMASITLKLLLVAAYIGIASYFFREQKVFIALGVFIVYVVNTYFLSAYLIREMRASKKQSQA
jgi:hypothetical protein